MGYLIDIDVVKDNFLMQQFAKQHGTPLRGGDSATKKVLFYFIFIDRMSPPD